MSAPGPLTGSAPITFTVQGVVNVAGGAQSAGATHIPPGIMALPSGTYLKGTIDRLDGRRQPILHTVKGDITLASSLPLKLGQEVVLRLETRPDGLHARLITVDGKTPGKVEATQVPADEVAVMPNSGRASDIARESALPTRQAQPAALIENTAARVVSVRTSAAAQTLQLEAGKTAMQATATLLQRAPDLPQHLARLPASIPVPAARLQPGTLIQMLVTLPVDGNHPAPAPVAGGTVNANFASASRAYGGGSSPATPSTAERQAIASLPPSFRVDGGQTGMLTPTPAWTLTVLQQEPEGVTLRSPLGLLHLPAHSVPGAAAWQPGMQVQARPLAIAEAPLLPVEAMPVPESGRQTFPALEAFAEYAAHAGGSGAMYGLTSVLPKPDSGFVALVMHFFGVMKQPSVERWLGRNHVKLLEESGKSELLGRLGTELTRHAVSAGEVSPSGWQQVTVPVWVQETVRYAHFHLHRDPQEDDQSPKSGRTQRFVIELDFDGLGQTQLDGFVRRSGKSEPLRFDLALRTEKPLASRHIEAVSAIYRQAAEEANFHGQLSFRLIDPNEPCPWRERLAAPRGWTA